MQKGFWTRLPKPIIAMAPMANVTDAAFRRMFAECGPPDVFWTEFVSVEGLLSEGRQKLLPDFWFTAAERPIVAQIFGSKPEQFEAVGPLLLELGFDGVDINMGCPDRAVVKQCAGAGLIRAPKVAREIIQALRRGVGDLPISIKTRIGDNEPELQAWIPELLGENLAALTVHLRTRKEMSEVAAHWELAPEIAALRDRYAPETLVLGNGDVATPAEGREKCERYGLDGVMIGRGIFGNPWLFADRVPDMRERLTRLVRHVELFEELYKSDSPLRGERLKNFDVMKKHFKAYVNGFDGAKELRAQLMEAENAATVRRIIEERLGSS